jgi:hypothetical protein
MTIRGSVTGTVAGSVVLVVGAGTGSAAVGGAVVGTLLAVSALAVGPLVLPVVLDRSPVVVLATALTSYLLTVLALGVAYAALSGVDRIDGRFVGAAMVVATLGTAVGQLVAVRRSRVFVVDQDAAGAARRNG